MTNKFQITKLMLMFVVAVCIATTLSAEPMTNYHLNGGVTIGGNFYFSDFYELPGIPSCNECDGIKYDFGLGLGYSIFAGGSKETTLFNRLFYAGADVDFSTLSATYSTEAKLSNWIDGDNYGDAMADHKLEMSLYSIGLTPNISTKISEEFPLSISLGARFGMLFGANYRQYEELVSPPDYTFSNGSNKANEASGDVDNLSIFYLGVMLGFAYDVYHFGNFTLSPTLVLNYSLTDVASNLNWQAHSAKAGIVLSYHIPKYVPPEPELPILPSVPKLQVPTVSKLELALSSTPKNDTLLVDAQVDVVHNATYSLPIIYFEPKTDKLVSGYDLAMFQPLKNTDFSIEIGLCKGEDSSLAGQRFAKVRDLLKANGITANTNYTIIQQEKRGRNADGESANAFVKFNFAQPIVVTTTSDSSVSKIGNAQVKVDANIIAEAKPYNYVLSYSVDGNATGTSNDEHYVITIAPEMENKQTLLDVICSVTDSERKTKTDSLRFMILPKFEYHHYTNANTTDAYFSEQVLGFFNFDDSNFCAINEQVLREVKEHLQNGRRIEITAMTDGFGTTAYNANLAQQRANTAVGIIDSSDEYKSLISIGQQQTSTDTNATPYQQQRRRVVIVRFMK